MNIGRTRADRIYNAILLAVAVCFLGYALFMAMGCSTENETNFVIGDIQPGRARVIDANTSTIPFIKSDHRLTAWRDAEPPYALHVDVEGADSSSLGSLLSTPLQSAVTKFQWTIPAT